MTFELPYPPEFGKRYSTNKYYEGKNIYARNRDKDFWHGLVWETLSRMKIPKKPADYPAELAELIILVANVWMNPMIFDNDPDQAYRKFMVFGQMLRGFGLDILDEEILSRLQALSEIYQARKARQ